MLAETLLRSLVHAEKTDLIRIDPEGIVLFASGESIPGFLQRTDSLRGASFFDLFAKMSGPLAAAKQALRGETTSTADWNQGRMLELQMFPERSENGDIVGAIGIARDQTEAATLDGSKENQWLLETAFESIQDGVMVLDRNLVVRQANKVIRSWLPEVVPNRYTCYKTLVGIDEPCSFCPCLKTFKTGERFEYIYYNPNYKRWYELTTHPIIDPNTKEVVLVVEFVRDVDETVNAQKKLEEYRNQLEKMVDDRTHALRESESRMQVLLSNSNSPIFFIDTEFCFTYANAAFRDWTGYEEHELLGRPVAMIYDNEFARQSQLPTYRAELLNGTTDKYRIEVAIRTKDGDLRWGDMNVAAVRDSDGKMLQIIAVILDVTERLTMLGELEAARVEAMKASEAKSQFLATMSHEIRTPLNGVIGLSDLLLGTKLDPKQDQYVQLINASGKTLLYLINDILDFSKIEAEKLDIDVEEFNVVSTVESVLGILASRAESKNLELCVSFGFGLPRFMMGDSGRIRQILINLVGNAVKFTEKGGVQIELVPESWNGDTIHIRFNIRDTGIGIPADRLDRLFKRFSQADSSSTRIYGGTGLGLAISMRLVQLMGGTIGVESEPGKGSNFWFRLPLTCRPEMFHCIKENVRQCLIDKTDCCSFTKQGFCVGVNHMGRAKGLDVRGRRILLVDDNIVQKRSLTEQLTVWSFDVASCETKRDAMEFLKNAVRDGKPFDLIIVDNTLPDGSAKDLIQEMGVIPAGARPKTIYLTPLSEHGDPFLNDSGATCVSKPVFASTLFDTIMSILFADHEKKQNLAVVSPKPVQPEKILSPLAGQVRILVAEDNRVNQLVAKTLLTEAGFECKIASNGHEAYNEATKGKYDLIFMDCQMPEMDGYEATDQIRKWEMEHGRPRTPIIALTANATREDEQRCLNAGMDAYCIKPINPPNIIHMIETWCRAPEGK